MTAGTVVIAGGILASVILLCIIAVLCYCRLQYYCGKQNGSEVYTGLASDPQHQFSCNICITPLHMLPCDPTLPFESSIAHGYCPTCTPHHLQDDLHNAGERLQGFIPGLYENTHSTALGMVTLLSRHSLPDFITNTHTISTDV